MKYVRNFDSFRENRKKEQQFNEELDLKAGLQKLGQKLTAGVNWIKGKIQSFANSFSKMKGKAKLAAIEALLPSEVVKYVYDQVKKVNPKAIPVKNESFLLESLLLEERTSVTGEVVLLAPDVKKLKEAAEQAKIKLNSVEGLKDKRFTEQEMKNAEVQASIKKAIKDGEINQGDIDAINEYHNLLITISKGTKFERGFMKGGGKIGNKWKDISREDFDSDKEYQQALDRIKQAQSQGQDEEEEVQSGVQEEEEDTGIGKQPEWAKEIAQACEDEGISVEVEMIPKLQPSLKGVHTKIENMKIPDGAKKTIKILSTILFFGILFLKGTSGMAATAGHAPGDDHKFMGDDDHKDVKDVKGGDKGKVGDDKGKEGEKGKDGKKMTSKEKQEAKQKETIKKYGDPRNFFEKLMGKKVSSTSKTVSEKTFKVTKSLESKKWVDKDGKDRQGIKSIEEYVEWLQTEAGGGWHLDSEKSETFHEVMKVNAPDEPVKILQGDVDAGDDIKEGNMDFGDMFKTGKFELKGDVKADIESQIEKIASEGGIITNFVIESSTDTEPVGKALSDQLVKSGLDGDNKGLADARINAIGDVLKSIGIDDDIITKKPAPDSGEKLNWKELANEAVKGNKKPLEEARDKVKENRKNVLHILYYNPGSETKPVEDVKVSQGEPGEKTVDKEVKTYKLGKSVEVKKHKKGGGGGNWKPSKMPNMGSGSKNVVACPKF